MIKRLLTALLIIGTAAGGVYAGNVTCAKVGEWGTDRYRDVFVQGSYAYCAAEETGLDIIDIGSPTSPKKVGNIESQYARRVWVNGKTNHAYLADTGDVKIIDISVPSAPKLTGAYDPGGLVEDVVVVGNYAFVISSIFSSDFFGKGELHILDVSNPAAPAFLGKYETDVISSLYINNNYVYLAAYYYDKFEVMHSHLDIVDISDYTSPQKVGRVELDDSDMQAIAMQGNYVYLGVRKLTIIDVSNPNAPFLAGNTAITGDAISDIFVGGNYAYVANSDGNLDIFNVSAPAAPALVTNCQTPGGANGVYVQGNYAYVADMNKGLQVIEISDLSSVHIAGSYGGTISFNAMSISGDYAYIGTSSEGLMIMDISDKTSPTPVGNYQLPNTRYYINGVHVKGNYAYLVDGIYNGARGFKVLNISNPAAPTRVGTVDSLRAEHIFAQGNYAYTVGDTTGLTVIDVSTPSHPVVKGTLSLGEAVSKIFVSGNHAYIAGETHLLIVNITNPASPVLAGSLAINDYNSVFVQDNYAYLAGNTFSIIDVSEPGTPALVGQCDHSGFDVTVSGDHAFIAASFLGLKIIDISDPTAPFLSGAYGTPGLAKYIDGAGDYIYLGDSGAGQFFIYKVSIASHLVLDKTALHFSASTSGFKTDAQNILIANRGQGVSNWQASTNQHWLFCTPGSGTNAGVVSVSVNTEGLAVGTYTGSITVSDPAADNSPQTVAVTLKVYDDASLSGPFGDFATPVAGSTVQNSIPVTGWALDDIAVDRVDIYREQGAALVYIGQALFIDGARPDVETAYPGYPLNYKAGWGYMMLTNILPGGGNGTFTLHAIAADAEGNQVTLGTKTITCDNAHAVKPFGAIDTPAQGGVASGSNYINWGWVLTASPNHIPTDGSTIHVWIDGVNWGHPHYNQNRPDIAALFPGYLNSEGAGGYYHFNTTGSENGVHTIAWTAEDNAGNIDGIGSRYFTIQNTGIAPSRRGEPACSPAFDSCSPFFVSSSSVVDRFGPVGVCKGYAREDRFQHVYPDGSGSIRVEIKELERVALLLKDEQAVENTGNEYYGYLSVGGRVKPMPVGATLDIDKGIFYWQPGPGFVGNYPLVFIIKDRDGGCWKKRVLISIKPICTPSGQQ